MSAALHGKGNARISNEEIKAFISQPGRTAEEILDAAAKHNVSKDQIAEAMRGDARFTNEQIDKHLNDRGIVEPPKVVNSSEKPTSAKVVLGALHGEGNNKISKQIIQEYIGAAGRTESEVVRAAIEYNVSIQQIAGAMTGRENFSVDQLNTYLSSWGLDKTSLINTEVSGWTPEDFDKAVASLNAQGTALDGLHTEMIASYAGVDPLMVEARQAQDDAARLEGEYAAIAQQVDRGLVEFNELETELKAAQDQLAQAQADLQAGEQELANVPNVEERRDRQATAGVNAQYKIDQANHRIQEAQQRIADAQSRIDAMKSWGLPLMEQRDQLQKDWEAADAIAQQKSEVAAAQVERVGDLATLQNNTINDISMGHDKLVAYLAMHPNLAGAEEARKSIQGTMLGLSKTLESNRALTDQWVAQGMTLNDEAVALETQAANLYAELNLEQVLLQRAQAEERLLNAEQEYAAARDELQKARGGLDDAYVARMDANFLETKGMRARGRDEANRGKELNAEFLSQAQQRFDAAKAELDAARAESLPIIDNALKVQAQWDRVRAQAVNARGQVQDQISLASLAVNLENTVQSALATGYMQMIGVSDVKVMAAQEAAATGQIGLDEFLAIEKSVRIDLEESIAALKDIEATATNDRAAEELARQHYVAMQTKAYGDELIASHLASDADMWNVALGGLVFANPDAPTDSEIAAVQYWDALSGGSLLSVQEAQPLPVEGDDGAPAADTPQPPPSLLKEIGNLTNGTNVSLLKDLVQQAAQRVQDATVRQERADMLMDWAEGKVDPAKQAKKIEAAMPELEAANKELQEAQQEYDQLVAQLKGAQIREAVFKPMAQAAAFKALGAVQTAQVSSAQANAAGAWAGIAQARYAGSDALLLSAQTAIARGTQSLAVLQGTLAQSISVEDPAAADLLATQAANNWQWGDDYLTQIDNHRAAQAKTREEQFKLDDLTMRAGSAQAYSEFLKTKAEQDSQQYAGVKDSVAGLNQSFTDLSAAAQTDIEALEAANGTMNDKELAIAIEYALSRMKPAERAAKEPEARANPQAFYEAWYKQEMESRKTMRKQLRIMDDIEQLKVNDEELKGIRATALQAAQVATASSAAAVEAGHQLWSNTLLAGVLGQRARGTHNELAEMAQAAAELSTQAAQTAKNLSGAASDELTAYNGLIDSWTEHANSSAALAQQMWDKSQEAPQSVLGQVLAYQANQILGTAQAKAPVTEGAQAIKDGLVQLGLDADDLAASWQTLADERQVVADQYKTDLAHIQANLDADIQLADELLAAVDQRFNQVAGYDWFANAAVKEHAAKDDYAQQLHEQRLRADQTYKKFKKKALIKNIIGGIIAVAAVVVSVGAAMAIVGPAAGTMVTALAGAVGGAVGSAVGQGINIGLGLQDKFSLKSVGMSALQIGITSGVMRAMSGVLRGVSGLSRAFSAIDKVQKFVNRIGLQNVFSAEAAVGGFISNASVQGVFNLAGLQKGFSVVNFLGSGLGHGVARGLGGGGDVMPASLTQANAATRSLTEIIRNFQLSDVLQNLRNGVSNWFTRDHMRQAFKEFVGDFVVDGSLNMAFGRTTAFDWSSVGVNSLTSNITTLQGGGAVKTDRNNIQDDFQQRNPAIGVAMAGQAT